MKRGYFNFATGHLRYNFGNVIIIRKGGRNWRAKIIEAVLDRSQKFLRWKVKIINHTLWYKMFPSDQCTHWLPFNDPNGKHKKQLTTS